MNRIAARAAMTAAATALTATALTATALTAAALACGGGASGDAANNLRRQDSGAVASEAVASPAELRTATRYLGIRYQSLPAGFELESGAVMPPAAGAGAASFSIDRVRTPRGEMLWLDSIVADARPAKPARIVRAELAVPALAADERLVIASCDVSDRLDPHVVAIVVVQPGVARFTSIRQAWRADAATGRFDVMPVTGIVCDEPGS